MLRRSSIGSSTLGWPTTKLIYFTQFFILISEAALSVAHDVVYAMAGKRILIINGSYDVCISCRVRSLCGLFLLKFLIMCHKRRLVPRPGCPRPCQVLCLTKQLQDILRYHEQCGPASQERPLFTETEQLHGIQDFPFL